MSFYLSTLMELHKYRHECFSFWLEAAGSSNRPLMTYWAARLLLINDAEIEIINLDLNEAQRPS